MLKDYLDILHLVYLKGLAVQSNEARTHAQIVAALACNQFITTKEGKGQYGRRWRITRAGLTALRDQGIL